MKKINKGFIDSIDRSEVLGCDPAIHFGYHCMKESGTWYFPNTNDATSKFGSDYHQLKRFRETMIELIVRCGIKVVASEAIDGSCKSWITLRKLAEFHGVMQELCATLDVPILYFNQRELKKWATGSGNAKKEDMIEACRNRWHIEPLDDNNADAIHIYMHFVKRYGL